MLYKVAVIGLGRFGMQVATSLARRRFSVLAIDRSAAAVQRVADSVDRALALDATDEQALSEVGLEEVSAAVCAVGDQYLEASILVTAVLAQLGVPRIIARHVSPLHRRILLRVGAHETINPAEDMGERLALRLARPGLVDVLPLSEGVSLAEVVCPQRFAGHTIRELDIRNRYGLSVVALRRRDREGAGATVRANPRPDEKLHVEDELIVIGADADVDRLIALK